MDILLDFLARLSPFGVAMAAAAAAGTAMAFIGLTSTSPLDIQLEASRRMGARELGLFERWQKSLYRAGIYVSIFEVLAIGGMCGLAAAIVLLLLQVYAVALAALVAGPLLYVVLLSVQRDRAIKRFRDALPDTIDDVADQLKLRGGALHEAIARMAVSGPRDTRDMFIEAQRLIKGGVHLEQAIRDATRRRSDNQLAHFVQVLLDHYDSGNPQLHDALTRIARAVRDETVQKRSIHAAQAGGRLVAVIYGLAPTLFLLIFRSASAEYAQFYGSFAGQIVQVFVVMSGVLSWYAARKVAARGLDTAHMGDVRSTGLFRRAAPTVRVVSEATKTKVGQGRGQGGIQSEPLVPAGAESAHLAPRVFAASTLADTFRAEERDAAYASSRTAERYAEHPAVAQLTRTAARVAQQFGVNVDGRAFQVTESPLHVRGRALPSRFQREEDAAD